MYGVRLRQTSSFEDIIIGPCALVSLPLTAYQPDRVAQSVGQLTRKSEVLGFDTRSGHILPFLLPLIQGGQLSVTGESMCTK